MIAAIRHGILLGAATTALWVGTGCSDKKANQAPIPGSSGGSVQPVEVVELGRRDLVETLALVGSLAPNETAQLRAEISGQVREVLFEEGGKVVKDQVLLRLDDSELRAQLARAEAQFNLAELNLKRSENLTEARSMSQAEADRIRSEHASAQAEVQLLKVRLGKMEIKAPFDGIVGARPISPGDFVTAATAITTLDDLSRLKIEFQVPERYVAKVDVGTEFEIVLKSAAGVSRTRGKVYFVSSIIDRATRSTQVKGYVESPPATMRPGMFANVELVLDVRRGVLAVPEGAVLTTAAGTSLIVVQAGAKGPEALFVPVKLGLRALGQVEVQSASAPLEEGRQIVASGVGGLNIFPGTRLEPRPLRPEFQTETQRP
ncbi:MAG: efflux RND transporter periplasmic adaptor subunit [Opitutaceae bacterium]|nr:efflux RND transporter periplasmic adaptor subunit [Opitutaceae bacterium]